jgi:uncharacterized protein
MIFHSPFEYYYLWLPLIGFVIGFLGSFWGGGGGFFFIPLLTLLFKVPAQMAVPTSLAATLPICLVGAYGHYRKGNIDLFSGLFIALSGIAGAACGAGLTSLMTSTQLKASFGAYSIIIAVIMIISNWREKRDEAMGIQKSEVTRVQKITKCSLLGLISGAITGTFGTSGTAPVIAGLFSMRMPVKLVVGTSLLVVFTNTASALAAHFLMGKIDLTLVYFLTAGTILGALTGPRILADIRIEHRAEGLIRNWYALAMIAFGIVMIISN